MLQWEPIKLEHTVHMPDTIDTVPLQGHGLQPSETEIDEDSELNVVAGSSKPKQTAAVCPHIPGTKRLSH